MSNKVHWLSSLVNAADSPLRAMLRRRAARQSDVADLVQEVYLRLLRHPDPAAIENPEAYLFTVARNLAWEHAVASRGRGQEIPADEAESEPGLTLIPRFEDDLDENTRNARLRDLIAELPPKCRDAVVLHYHDGLSYAEAGDRLGVSPNTIKKYIVRSLAHFRLRLGGDPGERS